MKIAGAYALAIRQRSLLTHSNHTQYRQRAFALVYERTRFRETRRKVQEPYVAGPLNRGRHS
jgi:hypothetical protein